MQRHVGDSTKTIERELIENVEDTELTIFDVRMVNDLNLTTSIAGHILYVSQ